MTVTTRIRSLLIEKGKSINQMAKDLSLGSGTFATWEKNNRTPTGDVLCKIADYFGVSTDYLLGRTDERDLFHSELSPNERKLLSLSRSLNEEGQEKVLDYASDLVETGRYIKTDELLLDAKEA